MNVARLKVLVDGDSSGAVRALATARTAVRSTSGLMMSSLVPALKATAAGFAVLATQAAVGGVAALAYSLAPLVGLVAALPALAFGAGAALGALKLATFGLGDALKAVGGTQKEFREALAGLSPAAADFMRALRSLYPEFEEFRQYIQSAFFTGLDEAITELANVYLPLLKAPLAGIAASAGYALQRLGDFLLLPDTVRDMQTALDNVARGFANATDAVVPLASALRDVIAVGSDFLPGMGTAIADMAEGLRDAAAAGRESGAIADFITGGITAARELGEVLGNLGGILNGIGDSLPAGSSALTFLVNLTQGIEDAVKSADGQAGLSQFFEASADAAAVLGDVLGPLLGVVSHVATVLATLATGAAPGVVVFMRELGDSVGSLAPAAGRLGEALGSVLESMAPVLPVLADLISKLVVGLAPVVENLAEVFATLAVDGIAPILGALITGLAPVLETVSELLVTLAPTVAIVGQALAAFLTTALPGLQTIAQSLVDAFTPEVMAVFTQALWDLIPSMASLGTSVAELLVAVAPFIPTFVAAAVELLPVMAGAIAVVAEAVSALMPLVTGFVDAWLRVQELQYGVVGDVLRWLATALEGIAQLIQDVSLAFATADFSTVVDEITGPFADAGTWLYDAGVSVLQGFIDGIEYMVTAPGRGLHSVLSDITDSIPDWKGPADVDAKLLDPAGRLVMGGFNDALLSGFEDTKQLLAGMTAGIAATPIAPVLPVAQPVSASGGQTVQITNHFPSDVATWDAERIDDLVRASVEDLFADASVRYRQLQGA